MTKSDLPFISVIVPFYNIEECVEYCLDSLVAQDYDGDYEILCIDDGSTDDTPAALDTYASGHPGVRVFHKPNGGLSDARNFGVGLAAGEYVSFVDGDDVVSPYYLSLLAAAVAEESADLVAAGFKKVNYGDVEKVDWAAACGIVSMTSTEFLRGVCFLEITDAAWASLARKSLYVEHPFPVGRVYEDTYMIADHVLASSRLAFVEGEIYGYVAREGSLVHPGSGSLEKCLQYFEALDHFQGATKECFSPETDEQVVYRSIGFSRLWRRLDVVDDHIEDAKGLQDSIREYVNGHLDQLMKCNHIGKGNKLRLALLGKAPTLYRVAFAAYDKKFRGLA